MFERGRLWNLMLSTTKKALASGALESIPTDYEFVEDGGVDFFVRVVTNLERKAKLKEVESGRSSKDFNPFLPYDEELFVCDISESHLCVLNKFNVVDNHLLIITREFEHQDSPLKEADFESLWVCMAEYDSLGFYNGGKIAGASQKHKHLQLVPLPLAPQGPRVPIAPLLDQDSRSLQIKRCEKLPFPNLFTRFHDKIWELPSAAARISLDLYRRMRGELRLDSEPPKPFNLLVTREWMLLVPRTEEFYQDISLNSIGFAGGLLVKDQNQMEMIKRVGPMQVLIHTSSSE